MSLYQKYRAKTFNEVFTQKHVTQILQNALKQQSYGHAYLLVGTRGSGKTSIARIFARSLNCENDDFIRHYGEPCNQCKSCLLALSGSHPDIIEMDAASNRGIEEIRLLKESIEFLPSLGKKKVYIIDEVHMMTKEAFNALLKTLEEPPKHVVFIFCTTEIHKLPSTITSRTQVLELKFASIEEIISKIDLILENEGYEIDEEGKRFIAKLGKGSFRDTESILENVLQFSHLTRISFADITQILGFSQFPIVIAFKDLLYTRALSEIQIFIETKIDEGNIVNFNYQVCEMIYDDIVNDLKSHTVDNYKMALLDFLCGLEKELKGILNQKILYAAKIMYFIANKIDDAELIDQNKIKNNSKNQICAIQNPTDACDAESNTAPNNAIRKREAEAVNINPVVILHNKRKNTSQRDKKTKSPTRRKDLLISPISEKDFLNFVKSRNTFMYKLLVGRGFQIKDSQIIVKVEKKFEQDLLRSQKIKDIMDEFSSIVGYNVSLVVELVSIPETSSTDVTMSDNQRKVEDLSDAEITNIFKLR
ncbi:MAG: DNA polymerase III subunit gamma/tau [Candidatus Dojkabacteria bacterium]|nr:MAG: DNA polymerase III subunit gamma/tau [Candidatus Dojkabacteria bacterium]